MKDKIHPTYFPEAKIQCACGATFVMGATKERIEVEICSQCHPLYSGKAKVIDTAGRIERFKKRLEKHQAFSPKQAKTRIKKISVEQTPGKGK